MPIKTKRSKPKRKIGLTILNIFIITLIMSIVIGASVIFYIVKDAIAKLPPDVDVTKIENAQNPVLYDANGEVLTQNLTTIKRTNVKYEDISPDMINAIIAIEDKTFWEHRGFNFVRMIGAIKDSLTSSGKVSGTSTITQQLARNVFLPDTRLSRSFTRKIQEAYYAMQLEDHLEKKQIITAYLNTIDLGMQSAGIEAAAHAYFSKSAKDLNYIESAMIAAIPKAPGKYPPVQIIERKNYDGNRKIVGSKGTEYLLVYNPRVEDRAKLILSEMKKQGKITEEQYQKGINADFADLVNPEVQQNNDIASYFVTMTISNVIKDLAASRNISQEEAQSYFYTHGLKVYTTLDVEMQKKIEREINDQGNTEEYNEDLSNQVARFQRDNGLPGKGIMNDDTWALLKKRGYFDEGVPNTVWEIGEKSPFVIRLRDAIMSEGYSSTYSLMPDVTPLFKDGYIVNAESDAFLMYNYLDAFDKDRNLYIPNSIYETNANGDFVIEKGSKLLRFNENAKKAVLVTLAPLYNFPGNKADNNWNGQRAIPYYLLYQHISLEIPPELVAIENDKLIIKKEFMEKEGNTISKKGSLQISPKYISFPNAPTMQPQMAFSVIEPNTGYLKAVIGGRNVSGTAIFNRAAMPQQSGSAIKPISVYGPGLDTHQITAATVVDDVPTFKYLAREEPWPKNAYEGWKGRVSIREAIYDSINVVAVKVGELVTPRVMVDYLKKNGVTTLIEDGRVNDMNLAALSLGGLTNGIPPVELTSAYATIANDGVHIPYRCYTKVTDSEGNIVLDNTKPEGERVFSEEANYILRDILIGNVDDSFVKQARIRQDNRTIPVFGKTGTTSNRFDLLFAGSTPYLSGSVWLGCDMDVRIDARSDRVSKIFSELMKPLHEGYEPKSFSEQPAGVVSETIDGVSGLLPGKYSYAGPISKVHKELFVEGTVPTEQDNSRVAITICTASGRRPGPYCPASTIRSTVILTRVDPDLDYHGYENQIKDHRYTLAPGVCNVHTKDWVPPQPTEPTDPTDPTGSEDPANPDAPSEGGDPAPEPSPQPDPGAGEGTNP
ncbi:transglycosylase domain-containing protein [Guggenheimella bovis]